MEEAYSNEQTPSPIDFDEEFELRIDVEEYVSELAQTSTSIEISFREEFRRTKGIYQPQQRHQSATIHKVSLYVHDAHNDIYIPKLMSFGPYHCQNPNLAKLQDAKIKYFHDFTRRMPDIPLDTYIKLAQDHKIEAMQKYSSLIEITDEQFVKIMIVDGCFLIEFLIKCFLTCEKSHLKQLMLKLPVLKNDLLLVQNQIPFFLVELLFKNFSEIPEFKEKTVKDDAYNSAYPSITLVEIGLAFLMGDMNDAQWAARKFHENGTKFDHLLHLYHSSLNLHLSKHKEKESSTTSCWSFFEISFLVKILESVNNMYDLVLLHPALASHHSTDSGLIWKICSFIKKTIWSPILSFSSCVKKIWDKIVITLNTDNRQQKWLLSGIPNACYLRDTGFVFKKKYTMEYEFMDITQNGTEISIPILHIHGTTTVNFKNLIALEQCSNNGHNFTAYATFMSNLIVAEEDVALLKEYGIINNRLGKKDQEVVDFFSSLCHGIYLDQESHYLSSLFVFIGKYYTESYYKVKFYRLRKKYIPDYFEKPCAGLCLLVSVMVIIIAFAQVFFTIFRYFRHK